MDFLMENPSNLDNIFRNTFDDINNDILKFLGEDHPELLNRGMCTIIYTVSSIVADNVIWHIQSSFKIIVGKALCKRTAKNA